VNTTIDCVSINQSTYSVLFGGTSLEIPITLLGLAFFAPLAFVALLGDKTTPRLLQVTVFFSAFNVLVSLYLLTALIGAGTFCIFCITIYLGNLILLLASYRALKSRGLSIGSIWPDLIRSPSFALISAGFLMSTMGFYALTAMTHTEPLVITSETPVHQIDGARIGALYTVITSEPELDGTEPVWGPHDAPYTIVEYADYGCGHCAEASKSLKRLLDGRRDIQLQFKVFPLTGVCNPGLEGTERVGPCFAAAAAECAHQQGSFWQVNGDLFTNQQLLAQSQWNRNDLVFLAKSNKLDVAAFKACLTTTSTMDGVLADAISGNKLNIQGTPAFFLKGATGDHWLELKEPRAESLLVIIDAHKKGVTLPGLNR